VPPVAGSPATTADFQQDKLDDEELEEAKSEFDRMEREEAQVTADFENNSDGMV